MKHARDISVELKTFRNDIGVSQQELADLINLPKVTLSGWEQKRPCAFPDTMLLLLNYLKKDPKIHRYLAALQEAA